MAKFRKKPVEIEAIQFTGYNAEQILDWVKGAPFDLESDEKGAWLTLAIHTLEGTMVANREDWIIKGVKGEFYPCKPDIFEQTYEAVE